MAMTDDQMPQLFQAADTASLRGQKAYLRATRTRLLVVVAGALCGVTSWRIGEGKIDVLGLIAMLCFVVALIAEGFLWQTHPERTWYDGRAVAESVKTSAWKFAVGGEPFIKSMTTVEATRAFLEILDSYRAKYPKLRLEPVVGNNMRSWMTDLRGKSFDERRDTYVVHRLVDQQDWYERESKQNSKAAHRWRWSLVVMEVIAFIAALVESLTELDLYFTPTFAAAIGAVAAWLGVKQHDQLATAYATTVSDLGAALDKIRATDSEQDWAREMNDAEDAISREHTLWLSSRSKA